MENEDTEENSEQRNMLKLLRAALQYVDQKNLLPILRSKCRCYHEILQVHVLA